MFRIEEGGANRFDIDRLLWVRGILDLTPYDRQEDGENSPAGWP
jgi:hypothetical protein